ncbi:MAG TPA: DUF1329 domain-containing protein [Pseudomonadales bacterium]|nr:DUF1329 domain-containing protein [Pseudomonadales bacterium]
MENVFSRGAVAASLLLALLPLSAQAKVSPEEAAKLGIDGTELTPAGAVRAGNADGTIPAWSGGLPQKDVPKGQWLDDPYADDKPLFTITAQNYQKYADKLTIGQKAMFERHPGYKMNIYPTRRSHSNKKYIYEAAIANASRAELTETRWDFKHAINTWAFPIPKDGYEAVLNFATKPFPSVFRWNNTTVVTSNGDFQTNKITEEFVTDWSKEGMNPDEFTGDKDVGYFLQSVVAPAKVAGSVILIHIVFHWDQHDMIAWSYNPGQRRVRRAPQIRYDNPKTGADGLATSDQLGMYGGKIDRYDWKLVGKKEIYIPYNSYRLHTDKVKIADIIQKEHINQDLARYELHRVWQVEGDLLPDTSHIYKKRVFFMDEDSWQIVLMDHYDKRDQLWRFSEGHALNHYDIQHTAPTADVHYDLQSGRYLVIGLDNEDAPPDYTFTATADRYSPDRLRGEGVR